jgi:Fe-S-cluster-containing dehydrogenase component
MRKERGQGSLMDVAYLPMSCMHCDNASCIRKAENKAIFKRDDGIVIIDPEKAKAQKGLVDACPYGAIWWNEENNVPQKCTFCAHLLDEGWKEPRCVQVCPTGALRVVRADDSEIQKIVERESLEVLKPEFKTKPSIYYKNLYRFTRCFIAGSVAIEVDSVADCGEGASVTLIKDSKKIDEAVTDNYGDFKFDNLEENSGIYILEVVYPNYEKKTIKVDLKTSLNIGDIYL